MTMPDGLIDFLRGATMMSEVGIALFFFRDWRDGRDKLFLFFAAAFAVMAVSQTVVLLGGDAGEFAGYAYLLRLTGFVLIIVGIVQKNLPHTTESPRE